jgi:phosphosulfolactate phosphohydrolase-like enzyme
VAEAVARAYRHPIEALEQSADAAVLRAVGLTDDIAYCALESSIEVVPRVLAAGTGVAVVGPRDHVEPVDELVDAGDTLTA